MAVPLADPVGHWTHPVTHRTLHSMTRTSAFTAARVIGACLLATTFACAGSTTSSAPAPKTATRVGLKAGVTTAGEALFGARMQAAAATPQGFEQTMNSDLAFQGNYAFQGNFAGPVIWDVSDRANPKLVATIPCPAS